MRVYHFLSSQNALNDIALRRIRISRYGDLNDPFELLGANLGQKELRQALRSLKAEFQETQGLLCFTRHWENPVLWSHYASKHRGMCLGFDLNDKYLLEVEYAEERIPITFKDGDPAKGLDEIFVRKLVRTKYIHWKYEEEIRIVVKLDDSTIENGSYFLPFSDDLQLREVILGPLCEIPVESVRGLVSSTYETVDVRKGRLAFKWFKVVPDERYEKNATS